MLIEVSIKRDPNTKRSGVTVDGFVLTPYTGSKIAGDLPYRPEASLPGRHTVLRLQRVTRRGEAVEVCILECANCGKLGVAIDDVRITNHKCSGAWESLSAKKVLLSSDMLKRWRKQSDLEHREYLKSQALHERMFARYHRAFMKATTGFSARKVRNALKSGLSRVDKDILDSYEKGDGFKPAEAKYSTKNWLAEMYAYSKCNYSVPDFIRNLDLERLQRRLVSGSRISIRTSDAAVAA